MFSSNGATNLIGVSETKAEEGVDGSLIGLLGKSWINGRDGKHKMPPRLAKDTQRGLYFIFHEFKRHPLKEPERVVPASLTLSPFFGVLLMKRISLLVLLAMLVSGPFAVAQTKEPKFKKIVLSDTFFAEGSYYGDFNKDGKLDVVAGPYWYEGPDFTKKHEIYPPVAVDPKGYSECFGMFVGDFNGDGWDDVFVCPHPGTQGYWFENPQGKEGHWKRHAGPSEIGNESQFWADILGNGQAGPVYNMDGWLGFATFEVKDGDPNWTFHKVSGQDGKFQKYTHGVGCGDINGNGLIDMLEKDGWWEQPKEKGKTPWTFHPFKFADAAAHMLVYDIDGDGLNDVVTAWHCHLYGLVWYKQIRNADGNISWEKHEILTSTPDKNSDALRISQMHAFAVADFNGDGVPDFVTGKRYWAHGPTGDEEPDAPAVVYWFETKRDGKGGATFVPHMIDADSGVGTQVCVADLNGDGIPDVVASNKKGTFVFLSEK